jgi:hypothetical protein
MANNARVKTKKKLTVGAITAILHELNVSIFRGQLHIEVWEPTGSPNDDIGWSVAMLDRTPEQRSYNSIPYWLETSRTFETSHKMGGDFMWWVDTVICMTIRDRFDGRWEDDGFWVPVTGSTIPYSPVPLTFLDYLRSRYGSEHEDNAHWLSFWPVLEQHMTPELFWKEIEPYLTTGIFEEYILRVGNEDDGVTNVVGIYATPEAALADLQGALAEYFTDGPIDFDWDEFTEVPAEAGLLKKWRSNNEDDTIITLSDWKAPS